MTVGGERAAGGLPSQPPRAAQRALLHPHGARGRGGAPDPHTALEAVARPSESLGVFRAPLVCLGPPAALLSRFFFAWEGSPTIIDYRNKGTLVLTALLEDLAFAGGLGT